MGVGWGNPPGTKPRVTGSFCLPNDLDKVKNKGKGSRTAITEWMVNDAKTSLVRHPSLCLFSKS